MATRILMADVADFVKDMLLQVRQGLVDAAAQGISAEMPEDVEFTLEIISAPQSMQQVTEAETEETASNPTETTTVLPVTDNETTERNTQQNNSEGGGDGENTKYTYISQEE